MSNVKAIVCDIDGTLTRNGCIIPSDKTIEVIKKVHEKGILFGIASGRGVSQLRKLAEEWGLGFEFDIVIGLNGSEYYDLNHDEFNKPYVLTKDDIKEILDLMLKDHPDLNASIYRNGQRFLRFEDPLAVNSKKNTKMLNHIISDLSELYSEDCGKLMFRVSEEVMAEIEPLSYEISNDRYKCCKTQSTMMEFINAKASKGAALIEYCEHNNLDISTVMSFGDMENDIELLKESGIGVCMKNGSDATKAASDVITPKTNDEDGCAEYIIENVL